MEPFVSFAFDGPQHDDILAVNRGYGDRLEDNDVIADAIDLGSPGFGTTVLIETLSIDGAGDTDWYSITAGEFSRISLTITPIGQTYLSGPQNSDGSCTAGTGFDSLTQSNLDFTVIAPDQSTVLANADSQPIGSVETISDMLLLEGAGTYYVNINGDTDAVQLYSLSFTLTCDLPGDLDGDCDVDPNDMLAFTQLWLENCQLNDCGRGNLVADETINLQDFAILEQYWLSDLN